MYSKLDKSVLHTLKFCNRKDPLLRQIEKSFIKVFTDSCNTLLHSPDVKIHKRHLKALRKHKPYINKILYNSKQRGNIINQKGGAILPFLIPLIASILPAIFK